MKTALSLQLAVAASIASFVACSSDPAKPKDSSPATITVQGTVIYTGGGAPAPKTKVRIGEVAVEADAQGAFTVDDVTVPYDVVLLEPTQDPTFVEVIAYRGLTRVDPVLTLSAGSAPTLDVYTSTANISGALRGGAGIPAPQSTWTQLRFASQTARATEMTINDRQTGTFDVKLGWHDSQRTTGKLYGLQSIVDSATQKVTSYPGFAVRDIEAAPGQTVYADLTLEAPPTVTMTGVINVPDHYYLASRRFDLAMGGEFFDSPQYEQADLVAREPPLVREFTFLAPQVPDTTLSVTIESGLQSDVDMTANQVRVTRRGIAVSETPLTIDVPEAADIVAPEHGERSVGMDTEFKYKAGAGLKTVRISQYGGVDGKVYAFTIYTTAASTTLPELAWFGESLPRGKQFSWHVSEVFEVPSVDAAAGGDVQKVTERLTTVTATDSRSVDFWTAP